MSSMKGLSLVLATSFMLSFSPGSSFASGGVSVDPDSHTVYVRFSDKGSHDKSGIKIREGAKRGTPGHGGSHHKQSNPHAGKRQPPTSPSCQSQRIGERATLISPHLYCHWPVLGFRTCLDST